jgi:regulator of PEP synthase PpsR (kinase-PPPase family)
MKRSAFFISDGTGITAETLGQSLLAQFENITFSKFTRPYIDSVEKARAMVQQINKAAETDGFRPIIFDTIVNQDIREILATSNGFMIDIFSTFLAPLEQELSSSILPTPSASLIPSGTTPITWNVSRRSTSPSITMMAPARIITSKADLILVGVSRCGKTPTCLYMAMQFGIRAANYPLTEDDMERLQLCQPHCKRPSAQIVWPDHRSGPPYRDPQ